MLSFVLVAVPIAMLNKLNQLAALLLLGGADTLAVFTTEQLQALALMFLGLHTGGGTIAFILEYLC